MECSDFKLCISYYKYIKFIKLKKEDNDQYEMDNVVKMYYKEIIKKNIILMKKIILKIYIALIILIMNIYPKWKKIISKNISSKNFLRA